MTALDDTRTQTPDRVGSAAAAAKRAGTAAAKTAGATTRRAFAAAASARDAAAGAAKAGAWAATCRLGRGLRYAGPDYLEWVLCIKLLAAYEKAEDAGEGAKMAAIEKERAVMKRARITLSAVLALCIAALWTGGNPVLTVLAGLVTLGVLAFIGPGAAAWPGAGFGFALLVEIAHLRYGIADAWFTYGVPAVALLVLLAAARDGHAMPQGTDLAPAEHQPVPTHEGSIVEALKASSVKLPADADPTVVAPGVTWYADRTVWMCELDTAKNGRGPSAAPLLDPKPMDDFAARLGLGPGRLHLQINRDQGSRVHMIGVTGDPWGKPSRSPLLDVTEWDLWRGIPFGQDITRARVDIPVAFRNRLHGGQPDAGKSASLYPIQAAFALSPWSRIWVIDGGDVDTRPLFDAGLTYRWCTTQVDALDVLMELDREVERRQSLIAEFGRDHRGLGKKVSPQFFDYHQMGFDLLLWDEVATFTSAGDSKTAKDIMKTATSIFQRCRKAGVHVVLATQSPSSMAIDTDGRDVISDRFALSCKTPEMSDKILGRGHAADGTDASKLRLTDYAGWMSDQRGDNVVRADQLTDDDMDLIYRRGQILRQGIAPAGPAPHPRLAQVASLIRAHGSESMRTAEVVGRLRDAGDQSLPGGIRGQQILAADLRAAGVSSVEIRADKNLSHYLLSDVEEAIKRNGGAL